MSAYYTHLKLPFEPDMEGFARFETNPLKLAHVLRAEHQVDPVVLKFIDDHGMFVSHYEAFYTPPFQQLNIHADSPSFGDHAKLNFAYGAEGSLMNWWVIKDESFEPVVRTTGIKTKYIYLPISACRIVASTRIRRPTLVNVGRPHSVINPTTQGRYVGSLVLNDKKTERIMTIMEATKRLERYADP